MGALQGSVIGPSFLIVHASCWFTHCDEALTKISRAWVFFLITVAQAKKVQTSLYPWFYSLALLGFNCKPKVFQGVSNPSTKFLNFLKFLSMGAPLCSLFGPFLSIIFAPSSFTHCDEARLKITRARDNRRTSQKRNFNLKVFIKHLRSFYASGFTLWLYQI